jgi:L-asparaginase
MDMSKESEPLIRPRIILHGGAGNIRKDNLPKASYEAYRSSLLAILKSTQELISKPDATAVDVATHAVTLLEDNPLFNCGKGAVFTRTGTTELESSIMVSNGYRKRGVGCMTMKTVKNPIKLAREMLIRGERDDGGGAQAHSQMSGEYLEELAKKWGMETVDPSYFFTQRRWDEHIKGLEREKGSSMGETGNGVVPAISYQQVIGDPSWDGHEYLPQGTVGAVVLDRFGTICAATSTGGLTNKLPGRIGDTPTLGAGFWAEEWIEELPNLQQMLYREPSTSVLKDNVSRGNLPGLISACLPELNASRIASCEIPNRKQKSMHLRHAVGMSGTGNGDSFLRVNAVRTSAAISRFSSQSLAEAVTRIAGPEGELQKSAGSRWGTTGEGEGGIIGIELVGSTSRVVWDFNCGGMFRAWIDEERKHRFMAFKDDY